MMRKILITIYCVVLYLCLFSCLAIKQNADAIPFPAPVEQPIRVLTKTEKPISQEAYLAMMREWALREKPSTPDEIIAYANDLYAQTDLSVFTLEGLLPDTQMQPTGSKKKDLPEHVVYMGDSTTLGLSVFQKEMRGSVIATGSVDPYSALNSTFLTLGNGQSVNFPDALNGRTPEYIVLTFGTNGISWMKERLFIKYYMDLVDAIQEKSPDSGIIIQSIPPLCDFNDKVNLTNEKVNRFNLLLLVMAYSKDLKFLNTNQAMKNEAGYMRAEYASSDDGIHINEIGYDLWLEYLAARLR